ncbi:MAG: CotH kinase family protein, partial [Saprospiraceae bacterium]
GGCSRQYGLKSLNIYTRETKYGSEKINYPLFAGRDHDNYERIKLRNSGQDYLRTGFRDGLLHSLLWDKLDLELQGFQPSALFLNGEFWGVMNIRERYTDEFFEETLGFEKDEIDVIRNPGLDWEDIKQGNADDYQQLYDFIENSNFDNEANFAQAAAQIDINNFINYWATMTYAANADWPANNILTWKEKQSEGKWRYAVMDQDNSSNTGFNPQTDTDFNTLAQITDENSVNWPNHKNSTLFFRKLLENERFRAEYIQRTCSFIHLIYNEERTHHFIDSIQTMIDPYMDEHITKWAADNAGGGAYINWLGWVDEFRNFFSDRPALMRGFINDQFNLNGTYELLLNYDATTGGVVRINSNQMETPYNYAGLYFKGVPVEVTAVANPGYEFSHWLETGETESTINFVSNDDAILTPVFQTSFNIDIGSDTSICEGSTLQLDVSVPGCDCDYVWSDGTTESILEIIAGVQTTYTVTVTDDLGTTATDEITIAINSSPTVNANTTSVNCSGDSDGSINLTTTGAGVNYSYSWSTGSQSEDLTNIVAGTYDVTITGNNGCETVVENISVNEPDDFEIIIEEASTSCAGESDGIIDITVEGATPDYTFIWSNNATTEDQEDIPSGNYAVTITDAVGCTSAQFVELVEPTAIDANVIIDLPQPGSSDGSILLEPLGGTPPYTIEWVNGETENLLSDIAFGIYSAVITDANGCTYQEIINFFPVNWTEPKDLLKFEIMPNPAIDFCTVEIALAVAKEFNLQLKNTTGQIIQQYTYKNTNESIDLDISNMESGIYILELKTTDGMAYRKLIIQ